MSFVLSEVNGFIFYEDAAVFTFDDTIHSVFAFL